MRKKQRSMLFILVKITVFDPKFATIYRNCTNFTIRSIKMGKYEISLQNIIVLAHICGNFFQPIGNNFFGGFTKLYVNGEQILVVPEVVWQVLRRSW